MPTAVQLPTRKKEGAVHAPVTHKTQPQTAKTHRQNGIPLDVEMKPKKKKSVQITSQGRVDKKVSDLILPSKNGTKPAKDSVTSLATRQMMRANEILTLEALMGRLEVVETRGRKPKPTLQVSKGEMEALTLGMQILHGTMKPKKTV